MHRRHAYVDNSGNAILEMYMYSPASLGSLHAGTQSRSPQLQYHRSLSPTLHVVTVLSEVAGISSPTVSYVNTLGPQHRVGGLRYAMREMHDE